MARPARRKNYTPEDWNLYPWPEPKPGYPYGPTDMQEQVFIYHFRPWERPHFHNLDILLLVGGAGSGKTCTTIAEISELVATFPGCAAIVGGANMPLLKRNVMDAFGDVFSWTSPEGIKYPWEHPMVLKPPPEKTPVAPLTNGSSIRFLNINDPEIVRGFTADVFAIEEVNLMEADSLKEMFRRSRGRALPIRQFILNMNPSGTRDWVYDMFALKQFESAYEGEPIPIGEPCSCEYCHVCLGHDKGAFEWAGGEKKVGPNGRFYEWSGGECPNPECPTLANTGKVQKKENLCPGAQHYYRVVRSASLDNPHLPSDFAQLQKGALSAEEYATYVKGEIVDIRQGYIYKDYSDRQNCAQVELDSEKDLFWTHDFNFNPMCSLICQETDQGLNVVDEFTLWGADELDVAKHFVKHYQGFKKKVILYGDPTGLNTAKADSHRSSFKVLYDHLKNHGFNVEMGIQKLPGRPTLIPIIDRINNTKSLIRTADGASRLFINPKCLNLMESLRHTQWDDRVKNAKEDDRCDDNSKLNPKRFIPPVLMTHPQAALGYLISKRYPLLINKQGVKILDTDTRSVVMVGDQIEAKDKDPKKEQYQPRTIEVPPKALHDLVGRLDRSIYKERMEYEKKQAEEYEKRLEEKRKLG